MSETKTEGAGGFDAAAFLTQVEQTVEKALEKRAAADVPAISYPYGGQPERAQASDARGPAPTSDALGDIIAPYVEERVRGVEKRANEAILQAQSAADRAAFYQKYPEAKEHTSDIESAFDRLLSAGSPFVREDVYAWLRGKNFDKFADKREADKKVELERAQAAQTAGGGSAMAFGSLGKDPHDMSDEELGNSLKGRSF